MRMLCSSGLAAGSMPGSGRPSYPVLACWPAGLLGCSQFPVRQLAVSWLLFFSIAQHRTASHSTPTQKEMEEETEKHRSRTRSEAARGKITHTPTTPVHTPIIASYSLAPRRPGR